MKTKGQTRCDRRRRGFTIPEVVVGTVVLVIGYVGLYGAMAWGRTMAKNSRENLRATEIMDEKMEQIRLYDWTEITNNAVGGYMDPTPFRQYFDPANPNKTPVYWCKMIVTNVPSSFPSSYSGNMRQVSVVVLWTNYSGRAGAIPHARTNQTYVAWYGVQNYVFGSLFTGP